MTSTIKRAVITLLLTCVISTAAVAGDMQTVPAPAPTPADSTTTSAAATATTPSLIDYLLRLLIGQL